MVVFLFKIISYKIFEIFALKSKSSFFFAIPFFLGLLSMFFSNYSFFSGDMKKSANVDCCYQSSDDTNLILASDKNSNEKYGLSENQSRYNNELTAAKQNSIISDEAPIKKALAKLQLKRNKRKLRSPTPRNNLRLCKTDPFQIAFLKSGQSESPIDFFTSPLHSSEFIDKLKIPPQVL